MKIKPAKTWESKREFKEVVYLYANRLNSQIKKIIIRPMTRKWASCSTKGHFSFNFELLGMDRSLGEYVILHELMHYHVPNHGKLWKSLMNAYMDDYDERANELRKYSMREG